MEKSRGDNDVDMRRDAACRKLNEKMDIEEVNLRSNRVLIVRSFVKHS